MEANEIIAARITLKTAQARDYRGKAEKLEQKVEELEALLEASNE